MSRIISFNVLLMFVAALGASAERAGAQTGGNKVAGPPTPPPPFAGAAGPCFDNVNRYVDCGNGTVTDTVTGLIWTKLPNCGLPDAGPVFTGPLGFQRMPWARANTAAAGLKNGVCGLTDGSSPGDWRLPTKAEWEATIARAVALDCDNTSGGGPILFDNSPSLTNDAGTGCHSINGQNNGSSIPLDTSNLPGFSQFWSSSSLEATPSEAWFVDLNAGHLGHVSKIPPTFFDNYYLWAVRAGAR